ncbi:Selenocysteine lyase/Cysteine desulfurase [Streptoalloteichus tenebrarius]|uniref:Selenocysteine lyase/Cysteine desulfurase n=1 Tax=Streptoalloteichus tenebrarius (strain ATCC 17920 / DSM 40477 / JCM 4838 / CBS 697.72 / NBRC 16177 / NCIMB 11028 / NRRL B-12390 / A12253. 1 / ISP 5477) TaxID=1933 RepID=A0ABT1HYW1_STRSD|nr:kynureninase [Streptoalloteichus tenebrarius]MCP2260686.1 Selenocysteine lyase/Cysteine desulfurase [Streptoalloteichus tenebrarius]BFF03781.1 kynureninase [Streptoalloteichus tenebrarius]
MTTVDDLRRAPNALAAHYRRFRVADRLLLSGHSHQAWPDVALEGQVEAFEDAARHVDDKWEHAFARAEEVREGYRRLLGDPDAEIALAASTHDLVIRFLSGLDLAARPRLVTTDGEFHTLRRQLARLAEEGVEVVRVRTDPVDTLAARLAEAVDDGTSAVLVSAVLFATSRIVPGLDALAAACQRRGVELLVDVYHALGVLPVRLSEWGLETAWVTGGGYKYLQLGEGNCFLRLPGHADRMRPVVTGWFAEFAALADGERPDLVPYGRGAARFAGATYDPTSHYRAARVFRFFANHGLTPPFLREVSLHQVDLLARRFDQLDLPEEVVTRDRATPRECFGGFLALRSPHAGELRAGLAERGVHTDSRGEHLRFGPAPYLCDAQLEAAMDALGDVVRARTFGQRGFG